MNVKEHFKKNKKAYIIGGITIAVGTVIGLTIGSRIHFDPKNIAVALLSPRPEFNLNVIEFVERSTPSKPVHLVGTNLYFSSLSEAARETGHNLSRISQNVNGLIPHVKGDVFKLLEHA